MPPKKTPPPLPLTLKELRVLEFIELFMAGEGVAPTFQEIKEHFGFASYNSVQRYLKQLQDKNYVRVPGGNQKRAMQLLHPSRSISNLLADRIREPLAIVSTTQDPIPTQSKKEARAKSESSSQGESLSLPLLGKVAAGAPIESFAHDEFVDVPSALVRNPSKTFALVVQGQSMVEDGIHDGDVIFVQKQSYANNGETVVAMVNNQATVKRFYLHNKKNSKVNVNIHSNPQSHAHPPSSDTNLELRPANSTMQSMWYPPNAVDIQGIVVGLIRRFS